MADGEWEPRSQRWVYGEAFTRLLRAVAYSYFVTDEDIVMVEPDPREKSRFRVAGTITAARIAKSTGLAPCNLTIISRDWLIL
jgi:hypothetical protein